MPLREETSSCSLRTLIARTAVPMLALALVSVVCFLFSARSVLATPYVTRPWVPSGYCNAPHVNASHYQPPSEDAQLVHVSAIMRHHKVTVNPQRCLVNVPIKLKSQQRTPVALVPDERGINQGIEWDCSHVRQFAYDGSGARLSHSVTTPPDHPFAQQIWAGTCEEGQLTAGGFHDSKIHGKVWELLLVVLSTRSDAFARTSGGCIMIDSNFYAPLILERSACVRHTSTEQSTWQAASSLAWTPLLPHARGPFMHNLRGKVFLYVRYGMMSDYEFRLTPLYRTTSVLAQMPSSRLRKRPPSGRSFWRRIRR